jgi:hypothetical protein
MKTRAQVLERVEIDTVVEVRLNDFVVNEQRVLVH